MKATKDDLKKWILDALSDAKGKAKLVWIAEHIWTRHEQDLKESGKLLFTWQYDMRWAAMELRKVGKLKPVNEVPRGAWALENS